MSIIGSLKSLDFFANLNEVQIEELIQISSVHSYDEDYIIYYESIQSNKLLFLVDGLAKAYKLDKHNNEIFLYYIYENSLLSEVQNLKSDVLSSFSNVELLKKSQILSIDYKQFKERFLTNNILIHELTHEIISRSMQLNALINREFIFDSVAKVAMMIHSDVNMFNTLQRSKTSLILHINPATLSRVLKRLKRNRIIDITHGKVTVLDTVALKEIFEG